MAKMVKNVEIKPSPKWLRERLRASNIKPINNIVDITNFVMLEYGHPMHAFDLRFIKDGKINVRLAKDGEKIEDYTIRYVSGDEKQGVFVLQKD